MTTWLSDIQKAFQQLGGLGRYEEIYAEVAALRTILPRTWQAIIRREIESHSSDSAAFRAGSDDLFYSVQGLGQGVWGARASTGGDGDGGDGDGGTVAVNPGGQGYAADSVVKKCIETYAESRASAYYRQIRGAVSITLVGKPYDLRVQLPSGELHVEVKGSTRDLASIFLTPNEVDHARATPSTELLVVDCITIKTDDAGSPVPSGGRCRLWSAWMPDDLNLKPIKFDYRLPSGSAAVMT